MKNKKAEQNWWSALSDWLVKYQGRADYLFIYDGKHGRLDRCFERNTSLQNVDEDTVSKLYQAAAEGRLGLLRPKDLKPQLLTTDPAKMFSSGKEVYVEKGQMPVMPVQEDVLQQGAVETQGEVTAEQKAEIRNAGEASADPTAAERLRAAEELYRKVMYAPRKPMTPAPTGVAAEKNSAAKENADRGADVERVVESIRNAISRQMNEKYVSEQERLIADLEQLVLGFDETEEQQKDRRERERKAREELIAAQNMFIWSSVSEKREQEELEELEKQMEMQEQLDKLSEARIFNELQWRKRMENVSRELYNMDMSGADENACKEKIRAYLDGKQTPEQPTAEGDGESRQIEDAPSGEMWGNTLRHFCRFAASEVPLSIRHVQVAEHCRRILQQTREQGMSLEDLGLDLQDQTVIQGTIEMGKLVEQGLQAQAALTSGRELHHSQYRACLQSYLAMKAMEETLIPHVQAYQKEISTGDGPVSALQILMAHRGFRAEDLRVKAGRTAAMTRLERMKPLRVGQMIEQGSSELAEMGRQVMIGSCQMEDAPQTVREHKAARKSGPER